MLRFFTQRTSGEISLAAGFSLMIAILFSGAAIFSVQKNRIFAVNAVETKAEVVEILREEKPVPSPRGGLLGAGASPELTDKFYMVPVFQYKVDGAVFEHRAETRYRSSDASYSVGDTTTIYYNPENPSEIRDVLSLEASNAPTLFSGIAAIAWLLFGALLIHSLRLMRLEAKGRKPTPMPMTETKCLFVALEASGERVRNARMIRLVCRWIHPENGTEWLIRSAGIHPTELPADLELGTLITCRIDFDNPNTHEVLWTQHAPRQNQDAVA